MKKDWNIFYKFFCSIIVHGALYSICSVFNWSKIWVLYLGLFAILNILSRGLIDDKKRKEYIIIRICLTCIVYGLIIKGLKIWGVL